MTDVDAVQTALHDWIQTADLTRSCVLLMDGAEAATLHLALTIHQSIMEKGTTPTVSMEALGSLRKKVESILVQGGYGGDPRP